MKQKLLACLLDGRARADRVDPVVAARGTVDPPGPADHDEVAVRAALGAGRGGLAELVDGRRPGHRDEETLAGLGFQPIEDISRMFRDDVCRCT